MERRYAKHGRDRKAVCTCSFVGIVFLSLISLSPQPEVPPQDLPRRKCSISLLSHKASVKCSVLIIYRTKGTQQSPSDSYLLTSSSQSCGRGETDEEKKGKEGVALGFFLLVSHCGPKERQEGPHWIIAKFKSSKCPLQQVTAEKMHRTLQVLFPLVHDPTCLPEPDVLAASSSLRALHRPFSHAVF